jgi:hypothetical protein
MSLAGNLTAKTAKDRVLEREPEAGLCVNYSRLGQRGEKTNYLVRTKQRCLTVEWPTPGEAWEAAAKFLVSGRRTRPAPVGKRTETKRGKRR